MTPNAFLEIHVHDLQDMQVEYAFLRNSESYPHKLTGDIDLLVNQTDLETITAYYRDWQGVNMRVIQLIRKRRDLYVMLFFPDGGDRKFLVLEYYTGIVFRGHIVVAGERLLLDCVVDGVWRRLSPSVSVTYTFFHYVLYKGWLPSKYRPDLDEHGLESGITNDVMTFVGVSSTGEEAAWLLDNPVELQRRIHRRISSALTVLHYARQLLHIGKHSMGCVLTVHPEDTQAVMDYADKYHLYRPTHRYVVRGHPIVVELKSLLIVALGGLAVRTGRGARSRSSAAAYFEMKARGQHSPI